MQNYLCHMCKNYFSDLKCQAFQDGIPEKILSGDNDHSKPLKNQKNNIVFEPIDKK